MNLLKSLFSCFSSVRTLFITTLAVAMGFLVGQYLFIQLLATDHVSRNIWYTVGVVFGVFVLYDVWLNFRAYREEKYWDQMEQTQVALQKNTKKGKK